MIQPTTTAAPTKPAKAVSAKRRRLLVSSRSSIAKTVDTSPENRMRLSRWLAISSLWLAAHGRVEGVEDHEHVQQPADLGEGVPVLVRHGDDLAGLEAERAGQEVR